MPGPRNQRKKKQNKTKQDNLKIQHASVATSHVHSSRVSPQPLNHLPHSNPTPAPLSVSDNAPRATTHPDTQHGHLAEGGTYPSLLQDFALTELETSKEPPIPNSLLKTPFIYDPGDGPRVKDARAFLASSFAAPPSLDDPLCAEFADEAVAQMLCTILPEETALILWYNKSRQTARICPACQRLYRLGDVLADHLADEDSRETRDKDTRKSPYLAREQELSGLCSPICFILASYNYPGAIRSTWGRVAEELDDATWDLLDEPGQRTNDMGLGMLLKMSRCHDLGLGQLFFPELDMDSDSTCHEPECEREEDGNKATSKEVEGIPTQTLKDDLAEEMGRIQLGVVEMTMATAAV